MRVRRRWKSFLLALVIAVQVILLNMAVPVAVYADEGNLIKPPKKILSIVYDDSGSMESGTRYRDVNYAVQVFAALLNEQDEMYVIFMNKGEMRVELDNNIDDSLETIRTEHLKPGGGTKLEKIAEANNYLIQSNDPESQKWLVVFTDGEATGGTTFEEEFQRAKAEYENEYKKKYGDTSNIDDYYRYYMKIGDASQLSSDRTDNKTPDSYFFKQYIKENEIIEKMKEIAAEIAGKMTFANGGSGNRIERQSDNALKIHSEIPMYSVTVFSQGNQAEIVDAKDISSQTELQIGREVKIEAGGRGVDLLSGRTTQITDGKNGIIPAGDYTVTFNQPVTEENLVVMYEPAVIIGLDFYRNSSSGKIKIDSTDQISVGDNITAEAYLADAYGKKLTDQQAEFLNAKWKLQYIVDNEIKKESDTAEMTIESIQKGQNEIKCEMELDQYLPQTESSGLFEPKRASFHVKAQIIKDGAELDDAQIAGLTKEDKIDIKLTLIDVYWGEEIPLEEWPEELEWNIDYSLEGNRIYHSDTNELLGISVGKGINHVEYSVNYPDIEAPMGGNLEFEIVELGILAETDRGAYSSRTLKKKSLESGRPVTFHITANDRVLSADELEGKTLEIVGCEVDESNLGRQTNLLSFIQAKPVLEIHDDGAAAMTLEGMPLPRFLIKAGTYRIRVALQEYPDIYAECEYEVAGDWPNLFTVLLFLIIVVYLTALKMKAKFAGQLFVIKVYQAQPDGLGKELKAQKREVRLNWYTGKVWWPFGPAAKTVEGFKIIANGAGGGYLTRKQIMGYQAYGISSYDPVEDFNDLQGMLKSTGSKEDKLRIPETIVLGSQPFYLKSNRKLYQLTLR